MSKQEMREEIQGDRRQSRDQGAHPPAAAADAAPPMLKDVEHATVVVTNPTHFAVALRVSSRTWRRRWWWPKAATCWPQQIKEVARWHEIPVLENPPLAQALYRTVEVGQAIPAKLYAAVAEILAFVLPRPGAGAAAGSARRTRHEPWRNAWPSKPSWRRAAGIGQRTGSLPVAAVALVFVMLVPLPGFAARPAAGPQHHRLGAGAAVPRCTSCGRCSSRSFPACCCC